jgi:hypothetical protein
MKNLKLKPNNIFSDAFISNVADIEDAIRNLDDTNISGVNDEIASRITKVIYEWDYFAKYSLGKIKD